MSNIVSVTSSYAFLKIFLVFITLIQFGVFSFLKSFKLLLKNILGRTFSFTHIHTGKCIRRFGGIYAYCRHFIDRKW